jgi:hypothetical protein
MTDRLGLPDLIDGLGHKFVVRQSARQEGEQMGGHNIDWIADDIEEADIEDEEDFDLEEWNRRRELLIAAAASECEERRKKFINNVREQAKRLRMKSLLFHGTTHLDAIVAEGVSIQRFLCIGARGAEDQKQSKSAFVSVDRPNMQPDLQDHITERQIFVLLS